MVMTILFVAFVAQGHLRSGADESMPSGSPSADGRDTKIRPLHMVKREVTAFPYDNRIFEVGSVSQDEIIRTRTEVVCKQKDVLSKLWEQGAKVFPRNGNLLSAVREHGMLAFDRDTDFAILDIHRDALSKASVAPYTVTIDGDAFRVSPDVGGWPLMDGVIWATTGGVVHLHDPDDAVKPWTNAPVDGFTKFVTVPFYDFNMSVPAAYKEYCDHQYGPGWEKEAYNKCNRPDGSLYKTHPDKCNYRIYAGSLDFPLKSTPQPGKLLPGGCSAERT